MKKVLAALLALLMLSGMLFASAAYADALRQKLDIDISGPKVDIEAPDVDINLPKGGDLPEVDIDLPKGDVNDHEIDISGPKVDIDPPKVDTDPAKIPATGDATPVFLLAALAASAFLCIPVLALGGKRRT